MRWEQRMRRDRTQGFERHVVLHYHFFKNAGSTLESILETNFGERFARLDGDHHDCVIGNDALIAFVDSHPAIAAVASHHLRPPKPSDERYDFIDVLFLRHPLARLASMHTFYRRAEARSDPLAAEAKSKDVRAFFELLIERYPAQASSAQVNLIASAGANVPVAADLPRAIDAVKRASVLGTAERFDESAVVAEHTLRACFGRLDFSYVAQNVSDDAPRPRAQQLEAFRAACGGELFDRLAELNRLDVALFDVATEEVLRRYRLIDGDGRLLGDLRARCRARELAVAKLVLTSGPAVDFARYANLGSG
jgi:hypothetical protein